MNAHSLSFSGFSSLREPESGLPTVVPPAAPVSTYSLEVNQAGLPAGIPWGIILNGSIDLANLSAVVLLLANGTNYTFQVQTPNAYTAFPSGAGR